MDSMAIDPVIQVKDLSAGYKKGRQRKTVVHQINFEIFSGEMVCLAGANGIGKSTILKTIAGLLPSLSGEIFLMNRLIGQYSRDEIARLLSIVLTGKIPAGNLVSRELIALGRYPYTNWYGMLSDADHLKIDEAIGLTGSAGFRDQPVHELSDGQLQKILIARALAQDCNIILLDEPTAHLDLVNKIMIMKLLKDLSAKTGKAIFLASHELDLAMQVSDRLLLLTNDHTLISGSPEDLVLNGTIQEFIQNSDVHFDAIAGKFIPVFSGGKSIGLEGIPGIELKWTKNALERAGFSVTDHDFNLSVIQGNSDNKNFWKIRHPSGEEIVHTIDDLLNSLKRFF